MKSSHSNKSVRLAIFDIDGTIFRSSLLIELFNELIQNGMFPKKAAEQVERNYLAWLNRKGHYNDYLTKLIQVHYRYQRGCRVKEMETTIDRVLDRHMNRVYRFSRDLLHTLRQKGYYILAISNSQDVMVKGFAKRFGMHAAIGRSLEVKDGRYTGRSVYRGKPFPASAYLDKVEILKEFIKNQDLRVDLKHSIAMGDSEGDIAILKAVGHPIAFNPSRPLAQLARRRGWQMVVERKDVIYRIHKATFIPHA